MSKLWAVGYLSFFDNDLIVEIVEGKDWIEAINNHSKIQYVKEEEESIDTAKTNAVDQDWTFDVKEIN